MSFPKSVVLAWLVLAAVLTVALPTMEQVVARGSTSFLPADAPTVKGLEVMDRAFGSGHATSYAFVVLVDRTGLNTADQAAYRALVAKLHAHPQQIVEIQDYADQPDLRNALTSKDKQATYIPVGLSSGIGSPKSNEYVALLRSIAHGISPGGNTSLYVTGDPAMIADLTTAVNQASNHITIVSLALLMVILILIYRRVVTILIPLATIGVALLSTRGLLALFGEHGLALSSYTAAFVIAIVLGAGTDYSVFLISRFRDEYRDSGDVDQAVRTATARIGNALSASAATVILGTSALAAAKLGIFSTTGPAMAIAVAVSLLVSLTLTPILLRWAGTRIGPAGPIIETSTWSRVGILVATRPGRVLAGGLTLLLALAAFLPGMSLSFDERKAQPATTPSNLGNTALNEHFPANETLPDYILVVADHNMGNPRDLASLNTLSVAIAKVPGVTSVRSITQPDGTPLTQATISSQLATLAANLKKADSKLASSQPSLTKLHDGTNSLADGSAKLADGSSQAEQAVTQFISGLDQLSSGLNTAATKTTTASSGARQLQTGAAQLATALQLAHDQTATAVQGLGTIYTALSKDLLCTLDPVCNQARAGLKKIYDGENTQLLPGLQQAADGARGIATNTGQLADGLTQLHDGLLTAQTGSATLAAGERTFDSKLGQLADGAQQLADGAAKLPPGINDLITQIGTLTSGLKKTGTYLDTVHQQANTADSGGFYLPSSALNANDFSLARNLFLSADGKTARLQILGTSDPLSSSGQQRFLASQHAAQLAIRGTSLAHAHIVATGAAGLGTDLHHYLTSDTKFVLITVLLIVLLILIITLRSVLAPLYLLASVILSCAAALGLTTLFWQHLLGQHIEFNVPVIGFVLLVAVGADYNILLMTRMREHGLTLTRTDVARAVTATGPVITSAGVIFASAFIALVTSSIHGVAQTGFAVATGLLLDTFIVRTLVVPACAALLGNNNWWPTHAPATKAIESL